MLKRIVLNWIAPLLILSAGLCYQYLHTGSIAFSRSGAILVLLGMFIEGQFFIRDKSGVLILNSHILTIPDKEELAKNHPLSAFFPGTGLFLIVVGTFVWGFGDLVCF